MTKPKIYVTQPIAESALERLRDVAEVEINPDASKVPDKELLIAGAKKCDILFSLLHDKIDADVINANPDLKAVASMSITPDNIDLTAATARKIPVTVVAPHAVEATADIAFALLLTTARHIPQADRFVRERGFPGAQSSYFVGSGVHGKTIGLVGGRGRIGQATGRRARGFDMKVLYWGPNRMDQADEQALQASYMPLDELLAQSDYVSVHAAMRPETHHLISDREFNLMKPSAIVINTARGPIVDEAALARALTEKRIAGAGLDVFEHEPDVHPDLLKMKNVVMVPHLGSAVHEVRETMANEVVDNIVAIIDGRQPHRCVNPEIYAD